MGSDDHYREESPTRRVRVNGFWMDRHPVTNEEFAAFVDATGYLTDAERAPDPGLYPGAPPESLVPGSLLFMMSDGPVDLRNYSQWWRWAPGTDWRHPLGPDSDTDVLGHHPVVHVAYPDASAFCEWADKSLPTEAEWEFAARGGLDGAEFVWGDHDPQETEPVANTWQGAFPSRTRSSTAGLGRRPSAPIPQTATDCSTWPATCGSGPTIGMRLVARLRSRLVVSPATREGAPGMPASTQPSRGRPFPKGAQGGFAPLHPPVLLPVPACCPSAADDRHRDEQPRFPMHCARA